MKVTSAFLSFLALGAAASLPVSLYPEIEERQVAGNHTCKVIAPVTTPPTESIPCYYCDSDTCDIVVKLKVNTEFKFDCLCPNGQAQNGITAWDHSADYYCWVPANSTDDACPTTGSNALKECSFCGK
ncbi:hypothetical protein V8E51_015334 [Hyaloscypha variabilis]|uniref:Uncharacterized protein n=1 Tax=Hyaloscypha variabilis (strain UAMH 11265 / GT02V1 / F) TaxID=1149755 RepID=A0A2J6RB96_HYAVF|nr:hypothetical protein L207DRAFT_532707 [Hyaloscypha variabilis F]